MAYCKLLMALHPDIQCLSSLSSEYMATLSEPAAPDYVTNMARYHLSGMAKAVDWTKVLYIPFDFLACLELPYHCL